MKHPYIFSYAHPAKAKRRKHVERLSSDEDAWHFERGLRLGGAYKVIVKVGRRTVKWPSDNLP